MPRRLQPPGRPWLQPLVVFTTAAAVRIAVAASLWDLPLVRTPKLDAAEYLSWAERLASGDWTWPVVAQHGPGYPMFLAALLSLGSGSIAFAMAGQALIGAATAVAIAATARHWFGARAGLAAGLVYAIYGPAAYIDTAILGEGLLLFLLSSGVWLLSMAEGARAADGAERRARRAEPSRASRAVAAAAGAGVAFGAAALVRPTALLIAAACGVWLAVMNRREGVGFRRTVVFAAGALAVLAPALAKNRATSGTLAIQGYGGLNVYIGNSPRHDGRATFRLGGGWDALNAEASRAGVNGAAAQDRYYLARTWREIAERPGAFAALLGSKALWLLQAEEARDSHSYYFFAEQSPLLRVLPRFALLLPLACVGFAAMARLKPNVSLLLVYLAGSALTVVLLVVGFRYRMPLVPALAVAAGLGIDAMVSAVRARHGAALALYASAIAVAAIVSHLRSDARNLDTAEEWAFTGSALVTERRLADAEAAYREAIARDPRSGLAWDGLGLALYNGGRLGEARTALARAIAIDPDSSRALFHRALVDERDGRVADAADGYRRALALSPFDADVARHLGDALLALNRPADAVPPLGLAAGQAPGDGEAQRKLAIALGMSNRTAEARDAMRRAVEIMPGHGEAWLDLCLLSLDLGDRDGAAAALQRARQAGADPNRLAFATEALARAR